MKKWELLAIAFAMIIGAYIFIMIGFQTGYDNGLKAKGEWVKIRDTTFHYEFKSKP